MAAINFGNSYCGNQQSPLQRELEAYLQINDSQFNLLFSFRGISSMVLPFLMPALLENMGTQYTCLLMALSCYLGQYIFILGLQTKNYNYCLLSRLVFGVSDSQTIVQQTILCMWFDNSQLPIAWSMMLFMVKLTRAINDNTASLIYNQGKSLEKVFWVGLLVSGFSLLCTVILVQIHAYVIESQTSPDAIKMQRKIEKQVIKISKGGEASQIPKECWLLNGIYVAAFGCLHAFYPNMSKYIQENYGFSNSEAGHISALPYMLSSVLVPLFG